MTSYYLIKNNPRIFNFNETFYDDYVLSRLRFIFSEWDNPDFICIYYNLIVLNDIFQLLSQKDNPLTLSKDYFSHHYPGSLYYYLNFLCHSSFSGYCVQGDVETRYLNFPFSQYVFREVDMECFACKSDAGLQLAVPTISFFNVKKGYSDKFDLYMVDGIDSFSFDLSHLKLADSYRGHFSNKKIGDTYNVLDYHRKTGSRFKIKEDWTISNESYFGSKLKFEIDPDVKKYLDHQWSQILTKMKKDGLGWISSWFDEYYDLMPINSILDIKSVNEDDDENYPSYEEVYENKLMHFDQMQYDSKYFTLRKFHAKYGISLFEEPSHD